MSANKCGRCNKVALVVDPVTGEEACSSCGLVVKDRAESTSGAYYRSERRSSEGKEDPRHHGPLATLLHYNFPMSGTGTLDYDAFGAPVTAEIKRLKAIKFYVPRTAKDSLLLTRGLELIKTLGEKLALPKATQERAAYILRHAVPKQKGAKTAPLTAACVYHACKEHDILRTLKQICKGLDIPVSPAHAKALDPDTMIKTSIEDPCRHIRSWSVDLRLPRDVIARALQVLDMPALKISGKTARIKAAGALWYAAMEIWPARPDRQRYLTEMQLADLAGCTEVSVGATCKQIRQDALAEKYRSGST